MRHMSALDYVVVGAFVLSLVLLFLRIYSNPETTE